MNILESATDHAPLVERLRNALGECELLLQTMPNKIALMAWRESLIKSIGKVEQMIAEERLKKFFETAIDLELEIRKLELENDRCTTTKAIQQEPKEAPR